MPTNARTMGSTTARKSHMFTGGHMGINIEAPFSHAGMICGGAIVHDATLADSRDDVHDERADLCVTLLPR